MQAGRSLTVALRGPGMSPGHRCVGVPDLSTPFKNQHNQDKYLAISTTSTTT